jgi:hypothetical protein
MLLKPHFESWFYFHFQVKGGQKPDLALQRFALRNFANTNFYNEAHTLRLALHINTNSFI